MPEMSDKVPDEAQVLNEIRVNVLKEHSADETIYDKVDIESLQSHEWTIKRYLLHCNGDQEAATSMIKETLQWRKSFQVNSLKETDFPAEFYQSGSFFPYEKDKDDNVVIYLRGKLHRKIPEWSELFKKFFVFVIESIEKKTGGKKYAVFWDCDGAGLPNVDLDMLNFMTKVISCHYPYGLEYILINELPWVLHQIYNLAKSWVPQHYQRLVRFCNKTEVETWIPKENLPGYLGGTCPIDYRIPPSGVQDADAIAERNGLKNEAAVKLRTHIETYCNC